jgi:hypothetical protein
VREKDVSPSFVRKREKRGTLEVNCDSHSVTVKSRRRQDRDTVVDSHRLTERQRDRGAEIQRQRQCQAEVEAKAEAEAGAEAEAEAEVEADVEAEAEAEPQRQRATFSA